MLNFRELTIHGRIVKEGPPVIRRALVNTTLPSISGSTVEGGTLTVTAGIWNGYPVPSLTYQWNDDGLPIGGATATTYTTGALDVDDLITCTETATNTAESANATSNSIGPITSIGGAGTQNSIPWLGFAAGGSGGGGGGGVGATYYYYLGY